MTRSFLKNNLLRRITWDNIGDDVESIIGKV